MNIESLTQAEVYALYEKHGGALDPRQLSQLDRALAAMSYETQPVAELRGEISEALYYAALKIIAALAARDATPAPVAAPEAPKTYVTQEQRITEMRENRETWKQMMQRINKAGK